MVETYRRVARVVLALEAWKLDHGRLPASLDDLKGKYLSQIPVAVFADDEFRYEPKGVPYYVQWNPPNSGTSANARAGPAVCRLWSGVVLGSAAWAVAWLGA